MASAEGRIKLATDAVLSFKEQSASFVLIVFRGSGLFLLLVEDFVVSVCGVHHCLDGFEVL